MTELTITEVKIRRLEPDDLRLGTGFLETMGQLSDVGERSYEERVEDFQEMRRSGKLVLVAVFEGRIVGTGSLVRERKFSYAGSVVGHVEDIVTDEQYRRMHIGELIMREVESYARNEGFRKLILQCSEHNRIHFYERLGYILWGDSSESMKMMLTL